MSNWLTKIVFKNNSRPAINDTNLNQLQEYIENAIERAYAAAVEIINSGGSEEDVAGVIESLKTAISDYNSNSSNKVQEFNEIVNEKIQEVLNNIETEKNLLIDNLLETEKYKNHLNNYEKKHTYYKVTVTEEIAQETEYELPFSYVVGSDEFDIFYNNEYLIREKSEDDIANYREVGETGESSNKVMFGWNIQAGQTLTFIRKGAVEDA